MALDFSMIQAFYAQYAQRVAAARTALGRPLALAEKILLAHLDAANPPHAFRRGNDFVLFRPDRVAMQDATAQMALLQFMNAGRRRAAVPASVHCDHLVRADRGAAADLRAACDGNREVYDFLRSAAARYGMDFWAPGAGIIHQVVLEHYAFPGGMMIGTDSHTPNAGGLAMVAVGVGGADAVDVLTGQAWELKMPQLLGVRLTGQLSGWASPKDVILEILGRLTVKGATDCLLEYFGPGVASLPATGRATICNMGAEAGATCSLFPFDAQTADYLRQTGRPDVAELAQGVGVELCADAQVTAEPEKYYDQVLEIDLSAVKPHLNGPFTPDAAVPIDQMGAKAEAEDYPRDVEVALIGSCTNSSYQDLARAASVVRQALDKDIPVRSQLIINPGSEQIRRTAERDGLISIFQRAGALVMANACGPCIGQWKRHTDDPKRRNSIVTSFNRNFRSRADGNPNTYAFVASPEMAAALSIAGRLDFDPARDSVLTRSGEAVRLDEPQGDAFPPQGFRLTHDGLTRSAGDDGVEVIIDPNSTRLQRLEPFAPWGGEEFTDLALLIKVEGKCTTDHISQAGPWLRFRGHLDNISDNLLMGARNAFNHQTNLTRNPLTGYYEGVSAVARALKAEGRGSIIVAEDNYGEGSSREHAAMEPRFLGVRVVLAKSFARIHETNLKKQGMLALTFAHKADYARIREDDTFSLTGLRTFAPGSRFSVTLHHADGTQDRFEALHTYNAQQIDWFRAGSALNSARQS